MHIWAGLDPWIPCLPTFRGSMCHGSAQDIKAACLILDSGCWNEELVRLFFPFHVAEAILDIPLNRGGGADNQILGW